MGRISSFNERLAARITAGVSTMYCAYAFACIALVSLPTVLRTGDPVVIVAWIAQTFLQLVLLSIIMVGQDIQSKGVQQKIDETHDASLKEFEIAKEERQGHTDEIALLHEILADVGTKIDAIHEATTE